MSHWQVGPRSTWTQSTETMHGSRAHGSMVGSMDHVYTMCFKGQGSHVIDSKLELGSN